jgi:F0F1-type ATP synthase delta subunit
MRMKQHAGDIFMKDLQTPEDLAAELKRLKTEIADDVPQKSVLLQAASTAMKLQKKMDATFNALAEKYEHKDATVLHATKLTRKENMKINTAMKNYSQALSDLNSLRRNTRL